MRFRVLAGQHIQSDSAGKPRLYKAGETVDSSTNLVERFGSKFEQIHQSAPSEDAPIVKRNESYAQKAQVKG